jgi:hypothetical protein
VATNPFLNTLITSAPALPVINENPTAGFQNNYSNILRLYFNQIDTFTTGISGPLGMRYIDAPHISASDSTDQYATANDTPKLVTWDTAASVKGFTLNPDGTATAKAPGVYKIDYSLQLVNTDNTSAHDAHVWLQTNGSFVLNSSRRFTVLAAKNPSNPGYITAYSSVTFEIEVDDQIGLWWATDQAFIDSVQSGVYMKAIPAITSPYNRPANPSATGSIIFLGRL